MEMDPDLHHQYGRCRPAILLRTAMIWFKKNEPVYLKVRIEVLS